MKKNYLIHRFVAAAALFAALTLTISSANAQYTPATFGDPAADSFFGKFIAFPETHGDANVRLDCYGISKANGKLAGGCYVRNNWEPDFAQAVLQATKKGRLLPATDGKKNIDVVFLFQVKFLKEKEERSISLIPNSGNQENVAEYGPDHIGAQRQMGKEAWQRACPKRAEWLVVAKAHVDFEGVASSVDLEHAGGIRPTDPCLRAIIDTVESSRYSPTLFNGEGVPSSYVELFGN